MSDPFRPSARSILDFGKAIGDAFFTVADKLDAAEATTQFNNGQESLRRSVNQFSLDLQSDPDWKNYQNKGAKFIDQQNQLIDKLATNGRAKQMLQQWWMDQRDTLSARVGEEQLKGRRNETIGTANKNINDTMQDVVSGTIDAETGKAKLRALQDPLVRSNMVDRATAEANYKDWDHKIDQAAVTHGAFSQIKIKTPDGLPNFQAAHDFLANPKNTTGLSDAEVEMIDNKITHMEMVQDSEDKRTNDKLEQPLGEMYSKVMLGEEGLPDFKNLIDQSRKQWTGKEKGERDRKWASYYEQELRSQKENIRAAEKDNPIAEGLQIDSTNQLIEPGVTVSNAWDALSKHKITFNQFKGVQAAASPRVKAMALPFEADFKTDVSMKPEVIKAMNLALADFRSWVGDNMQGITDEKMKAKAESLRADALKGVVTTAAAQAFAPGSYQARVAAAVSAAAAGKPLDIHELPRAPQETEVPKVFADKKITVARSQATNGTTYYDGADGKTYQVSKAGKLLWWDGKTWQTLK